jgi:CHAT domain-containing protein
VLRILLTLFFFVASSSTFIFGQLGLGNYFISESELSSYTNVHNARKLYNEIHSNNPSKLDKKYLALAEILINIANEKNGPAQKSLLDSAFHCAKKAIPNLDKNPALFSSYGYALGNYYKKEGQYALALKWFNPNPYFLDIPIKTDASFIYRISIIELYMMLNDVQSVNRILPHIIQYASSKKKKQTEFLWSKDLLEKILLFNEDDSILIKNLASKHIQEITSVKNLKKLNRKVARFEGKNLRQLDYRLATKNRNETLERAVKWYTLQHNYDSALHFAKQLLAVTNTEDILHSYALFHIGRSFEKTHTFDSAHYYYAQYRDEKHLNLDHTYEIARFYSLVYPKLDLALTYLDKAIKLSRSHLHNLTDLSFEGKRSFVDAHKKYIDLVATIAHKHASSTEIRERLYDLLLFTKSAQLNSSQKFNNIKLYTSDTTLANLHEAWSSLKKNNLSQQDSIVKFIDLEKKLTDRLALLEHNTSENLTWKNIAQTLLPQEAAIEILRFDNIELNTPNYAALIITAEERIPKLISLGDASLLEKRFYNYYINCIKNEFRDTISYAKFWEPIASALKGHRKVYISPDGVYYKININTLLHSSEQFVLDEMHISHVFSTRYILPIYTQNIEKPSNTSTVYLIGSPDFTGSQNASDRAITNSSHQELLRNNTFDYLPGAKEEIKLINTFLSTTETKTTAWIDQEASETNIKQIKSPKVLHIATHGFFFEAKENLNEFEKRFNRPDPMNNSGLLFSEVNHNQKSEDGVFTAYEAMQLDLLETDMVILSACETGLGEIQNGEGVFGLQRGFKIAGTKYLIMSLWKVNDAITQELMTDFYTLWNSGLSVNQAFYLAQLNTKKKYQQPHYWGGFILL